MRYLFLTLLTSLVSVAMAGCAAPGPGRNTVQANLVEKSVFEGEWWYSRTVTAIDDDAAWAIGAAGAGAPWPGATSNFDIISNSGHIGRIRWVMDENFLFAYRSYEIVEGASRRQDEDPDGYRGQPLAVFPVDDHVDIRRGYNTLTGEPTNEISEVQDRRWYDRQYMRVDWSQNLVRFGLFGGLDVSGLFAGFNREAVARQVQEGGDQRDDDLRPQFVRIGDDPDYRFYEEWPSDMADTVHFMSFVTHELWTPMSCPSEFCRTSVEVTQRHAFLRIPPNHEYAVERLQNSEYDRFGIIRTENRTFIRGGEDRSEVRTHCNSNEDCNGAQCYIASAEERAADPLLSDHYCVGGLTPNFGETDFLTYYRLRHNFYADSLTDRECRADWECDNRYGHVPESALPAAESAGSTCDPAALRCTIPLRNREVRPVHYTLSPHYPRHLVRSAFETMAQWNESFMIGQRELSGRPLPSGGPRVECQSEDPSQYCFCDDSIGMRALEVGTDGTCAHRTDFFVQPSERGETDPFQCWVSLGMEDGTSQSEADHGAVNPSDPTSFSDYTSEVYRYQFEGEECMLILDVNSCDRPVSEGQLPADCEQLGDIRHQFFNYVSGAGAGWCGVMQQNQDPLTGEAVISPVNMGGQCLERVSTNAIDFWPVLRGEASEDSLFTGENVRGYFERLGRVHRPIGIANSIGGNVFDPDPGRPAIPVDFNRFIGEMGREALERVEPLGPENGDARSLIHSDRLRLLEGSDLERRLVAGIATGLEGAMGVSASNPLAAAGLETSGQRPSADQLMELASPFRSGFMDTILADRRRDQALQRNFIYYPREAIFTSRYNQWWADAFAAKEIPTAHIRWQQAFHRAVMLHEMGHGLGLEHNFAASYDRDHYHPEYHQLVTRQQSDEFPYALPRTNEYDENADGYVTDAELAAWAEDYRTAREERLALGLGNYMTSSLMDYNGDLSDMSGLGFYDRAAVYFNYFNQVEAFTAEPDDVAFVSANSLEGLQRSDLFDRDHFTWYRGGELCRADTDCPFGPGSPALADGQPFYQRCIRNTRFTNNNIAQPCRNDPDGEVDASCFCSPYDEDFRDFAEGGGPLEWPLPADAPYSPVEYLFCSNPRLNDISWCNTFDAGESFQETIEHYRQLWTEGYPRNYFRNFSRNFGTGSRALRYIVDAAKIYQHWFFRFFNEPEFRSDTGPLGQESQFNASVDAMNWLAELAQLPDVGSYEYDERTDSYVHMGSEMNMPGADLSLEPGVGFHQWSAYRDDLYGFFELQRAGVFWDKLVALQALTIRDWGLQFQIDERYFVNFYDLFTTEMTELFGGYIVDDPAWFAPRVQVNDEGEGEVFYLNYYRGGTFAACPSDGLREFCRDSNEDTFIDPPIQGTTNDILRTYAAIFSLAQFPVFYDPVFENRLVVFKLENGEGFEIPDVQEDGDTTCGFGGIIPDTGHELCQSSADADYALYASDNLNQVWVAAKVRPQVDRVNLEEEQLGFQLLVTMLEQRDRIRVLEAQPSLSDQEREELRDLEDELAASESFVDMLTEIARVFGITSFF
ncbi:MAG: zinc-dependent metalloprotease [Sandaracinaceae bacterium]